MHVKNPNVATIAVQDVSVDEVAGIARFTVSVSRSGNKSESFSVDYSTQDGTAKEGWPEIAGSDYIAQSGRLYFAAGEDKKVVEVSIIDDKVWGEGDETFSINLSNVEGRARIVDGYGQATIRDDDTSPPPSYTIVQVDDSTIIHQDDNLTGPTIWDMAGSDGVHDLFVFNADFNKDYELSSSDFAYIYGFKRGEDKIVIIDSDGGGFVEQLFAPVVSDECAGSCGCDECPPVGSSFEYVKAGSAYWGVSGIVSNSLIDREDIVVTTDLNYGGLIWA